MLVITNDNTGTITLGEMDFLDCVLIQSALIGIRKHGNDIERIDRLIEACDPAIEIALNVIADEMAEQEDS